MKTYSKIFEGITENEGRLVAIIKQKDIVYNPNCKGEFETVKKEIELWHNDLKIRAIEIRFSYLFDKKIVQKLIDKVYFISVGDYPFKTIALIKFIHSKGSFIEVRVVTPEVKSIVYQVNRVLNSYESIDKYIVYYLEAKLDKLQKALLNLENELIDQDLVKEKKVEIVDGIKTAKTKINKIKDDLFSINF